MTLTISRAVQPGDIRRFVDVPWRIHDRAVHRNWVPPLRKAVVDALDERRNPFYARAARELLIASRDGRPVGCIAAIENRAHNEFHDDRLGFFGFFECQDDPEAARALVDAAGEWLRARGLTTIRGPFNPSTNYECGVLVSGFEHRPMFMTPWNPPFYAALLEGVGMAKSKDLLGYHLPLHAGGLTIPPNFARLANRVRADARITLRHLEPRHFTRELALCWDIYASAWERNWGFVPMEQREFAHIAGELRHLVRKEWTFIAHVDGDPAGFILAVPDYNEVLGPLGTGRLFPTGALRMLLARSRLRRGRVMALGVKREYRSTGLSVLLIDELVRQGFATATEGEASWVLEDNVLMTRSLASIAVKEYRRWRIYEKPI